MMKVHLCTQCVKDLCGNYDRLIITRVATLVSIVIVIDVFHIRSLIEPPPKKTRGCQDQRLESTRSRGELLSFLAGYDVSLWG